MTVRGLGQSALVGFVLLSIWTRPFGPLGAGMSGRLVPADVVGLVAVPLVLARRRIGVPAVAGCFAVFLLAVLAGAVTSRNPAQTVVELAIHAFLLAMFLCLVNAFRSPRDFLVLVGALAASSALASAIGLWDVAAPFTGLPRIVPRDPSLPSVGVATFRNSGQAGAYILIALAALLPFLLSPVSRGLGRTGRLAVAAAAAVDLLFLAVTVKIAAIIGLAAGVAFWSTGSVLRGRALKPLLTLLALALVLVAAYPIYQRNAGLLEWFTYKTAKLDSRMGDEDGFIQENLGHAVRAFSDNPAFGSGLGGFAGVYEKYEVHSTYFKMLGETGLAGTFAYGLFLVPVFALFRRRDSRGDPYARFLAEAFPFFLGCLVSWGYTYHLRKREFWILLAILYLADRLSRGWSTRPQQEPPPSRQTAPGVVVHPHPIGLP